MIVTMPLGGGRTLRPWQVLPTGLRVKGLICSEQTTRVQCSDLNDFIFTGNGRHGHVASVAPGCPVHTGAHLPLVVWQAVWCVFILTVVVPSMMTGAVLTPPVIHHHVILKEEGEWGQWKGTPWLPYAMQIHLAIVYLEGRTAGLHLCFSPGSTLL